MRLPISIRNLVVAGNNYQLFFKSLREIWGLFICGYRAHLIKKQLVKETYITFTSEDRQRISDSMYIKQTNYTEFALW